MFIISPIWQFLTQPRLPKVSLAFIDGQAVLLKLKKRRGQFYVEHVASAFLPKALLRPDFSSPNIAEINSLVNLLQQTTARAGLASQKRWSIALPEEVARTVVVNLDSKPQTQDELTQMLAWKVERIVGLPSSRLRLVHQQISSLTGLPRCLVTVIEDGVMKEYESVFEQLGWHAGLILPRHICEASWLTRNKLEGDKLLVSHNSWGFSSVALRGEEPLMIRLRECGPEDLESEIYRLATYYQEKMLLANNTTPLNLLVIGDENQIELTARTFADALAEVKLKLIKPTEVALNVSDANFQFNQVAAAAGLAALAYN